MELIYCLSWVNKIWSILYLLVYLMTMIGNITKAQDYHKEFQKNFSEFGIEDEDYHNLLIA